ncbi:isoleucine--tRNA ligase [bacterium]|nr:isoleucine--tRNA ligase [bacterium]
MEYKKTINLPQTSFPMKANLAQKEPNILKNWQSEKIDKIVFDDRKNFEKYILHDGPPYANGHIHIGHALNKILKDIIVKYKTMCGYHVPYVPGWDCHGLPVEHQLFKELGLTKHQIDQVEFRRKARKYAMKFVKIQCEEFKRLGIFGTWKNPYLTINNGYEAKIARLFGDLYLKGYIYKGLKPIYWCGSCETALAEAEVEYDKHTSPSIYVKFLVTEDKSGVVKGYDNVHIVIWTTTPWTLPSNLAVAVKDDFKYSLIKTEKGIFVIASDLVSDFLEKIGAGKSEELNSFLGKNMEGLITRHPFMDRSSPVVLGGHVTLEQGTGCVHIAPGHGQEDFEVGKKYGLDILSPITDEGCFTADFPYFGGKQVFAANKDVINYLEKIGALLNVENIEHSYPHCWRCKNPLIFRATEQWFINVDKHNMRKEALDKIKEVNWIPEVSEKRITSMVENRPHWCLSRQRYWGVPIPVLYCKKCREVLLDKESIDSIEQVFLKENSDAWFYRTVEDLVGNRTCKKCGSTEFTKETDIIDVWFDSGISHQAVMQEREELRYPADLYLEGSDQHRGWFQSSLLTAVGYSGTSPFNTVLTHGFVVDGNGKKMSKSMGNVISPHDITNKYGADILRLWVSSVDYTADVRISNIILKQLIDAYRRIRNTFKYLLGNICDFDPVRNSIPKNELMELDKFAFNRLVKLNIEVKKYYEKFEFYKIFHAIHQFCAVDMSSCYLDSLKDHMYCHFADDPKRRSSQTVLYETAKTLVILLAPILPFTTEEVFSYLKNQFVQFTQKSVHCCNWPEVNEADFDAQLDGKWKKMLLLKTEVQKILEHYRKEKTIGTSLDAKVSLFTQSPQYYEFLKSNKKLLKELFIVSQLDVSNTSGEKGLFETDKIEQLKIGVNKAEGIKCIRCWKYSLDVNSDPELKNVCSRCVKAVKQSLKNNRL